MAEVSGQDFSRSQQFRPADLPKYPDAKDHPFKMSVQADGNIGFSPGLVRPSLAFGMPAFVPTFYGSQLKMPVTGQLTVKPQETGRYFMETTGFWVTMAAVEPRNLRVFVPTAGDIKHETDIAFGDPNKKLVQIGTLNSNNTVDQLLRSDLTLGDVADVPYTGPPGVGPHDPGIWGEWPTGSGGVPYYGQGTNGEADLDGTGIFDYGE
jgi:hypothetical protein